MNYEAENKFLKAISSIYAKKFTRALGRQYFESESERSKQKRDREYAHVNFPLSYICNANHTNIF